LLCARSWGDIVETIGDFVRRTGGPVVPFVAAWYPWAYAHHYLRGELAQLPDELGPVSSSLSLSDARDLIEVWCARSGESIEDGARRLADAYLRRWGLEPSDLPVPDASRKSDDAGVPTHVRQRRTAKSGAERRSRATRTAAAVETGVPAHGDDPYAMSAPDREG
jgi:hypothetical protein